MSKAQNWVEALQIDPEKLNEWSALAPDGIPLLVWALQEGHVANDSYLAWAKEHFERPVLRREYFASAFNSDTALQLHKDTSATMEWTPWLFPIEQWEDVTLVACVEPPGDLDEARFRCVLADAHQLKEAWYKFMAPGESESSASPEEAPLGMESSQISTEVKPFKLSLDNLDETNLFRKDPPAKETAPPPTPAPVPKTPTLPEPEEMEVEESALHLNIDLKKLEEAAAKPPNEEPREPKPLIAKEQPKPSAKPPPPPASTAKSAKKGKTPPALGADAQEALIEQTFQTLSQTYKHAFVMRCESGQAKLYRWDSSLHPKEDGKKAVVDLAFPTFLRILHKTNLPYHGYLVDSPAHRNFFAELGIKDLPGCVTALPIIFETSLVGVLVAIGDEPMQKLEILKKVEEAARQMVEALAPTWTAAA